jgi:DNA polymerase-3 subunit alpha
MDGVATPKEYIDRASSLGMQALAITDHGTLSGHREFYRAAVESNIKPILGVEAYLCLDMADKKVKADRVDAMDQNFFHAVILAKNQIGLENLNKLNEIGWTEGFYSKPRIDFKVLEQYKEGIIILSGCMGGILSQAIMNGEFALAKKYTKWFKDTFGEDFYIEVMPHNTLEVNTALFELAKTFDVKTVVTPDCHHAVKEDKIIQEMMLLLNTHQKVKKGCNYEGSKKFKTVAERLDYLYGDDRKMTFRNYEIYLLSYEEIKAEMAKQGFTDEEMFESTIEIANKIEAYDIKEGLNLLPVQYPDPMGELRILAKEGLESFKLTNAWLGNDEYEQRLEEELEIIGNKNFGPYFLVVRNMINWAKKEGIMVGPGRGSSAGSLLCYLIGITDIDPIKHGLLFFRFINPDRADFPDIDTDIQDTRRDEVKDYLVRQYRHVASIATFLEFKDKGVVRDVSRILNIPLTDVNKVLKSIDTWDEYCFDKGTLWFREKYPEVEIYGEQLRGRIRGTGIHAAGVVTSKEPIFKFAPMETRAVTGSDERIAVVAVDMKEAENIGLIKIDALGLKTLSVLQDTLDTIEERTKKRIVLLDIPMDDANVYRMLSDGYTKGVFQCEAAPYTNLLVKMGVKNLNELAASNALVRPGAMKTIGKDYIDRKHGRQNIEYTHTVLKEFTEDTYGCILYQEQVMQACIKLGGLSPADSDKVRKIIGKKKDAKEFDVFKDKFVKGASQYITPNKALDLWHDFEAHAGYSFNKSHAVAYSTLSYWTAWLKYHYPLEFMFCLLKNEKDKDARTEYLIEAKRMSIPIKLPHINESDADFKIEGNGIRFGLTGIKYISDNIANKYIKRRPFKSFEELKEFTYKKGSGVNSRALEALRIIGGATFPDNPRSDSEVKAHLYEYLNLPEFNMSVPAHYHAFLNEVDDFEEKGSFILMGMIRAIKRGTGWSRVEILDKTGSVGIFDDENTTIEVGKTYILLASDNRIVSAVPLDEIKGSKNALIKFLGYRQLPYTDDELFVVSFKPRMTKAGKKMASLVLADTSRVLHSVLVFPTSFARAYMTIEEGKSYLFNFGKTKDGTVTMEDVNAG